MNIDLILKQEELKAAAKDYLSRKLSIIIVGANKIPLIPWKEFTERFATPEEVDGWFERFPLAQIGMVTGKISGLTVVDVEAEGGEAEWNKLPQNCPIVKTGSGGRHYWYLYNPDFKNAVRIDGQIKFSDIRNDSGYVVIPPSVSDKGGYEWIQKLPPCEFPKDLFKPKVYSPIGYAASQVKKGLGIKLLADLYEGAGLGSRNDSMVKYIGYILTQVHPDDWENIAWSLALEANKKNGPPLNESELRKSFDSIRQIEKAKSPTRWSPEEPIKLNNADKLPVKNEYKLRYTWGTRGLDTRFAIIKRGNFIVFGAKSSSGKTTFAFDMAIKNAVLGHQVLFISLEMDEKEVKDAVARRSAKITIEEELDYKIPESKQKYFEQKLAEIASIKNLHFEGVRRGGGLKWEELLDIIYKYDELDLIIIDNLDMIGGNKGEQELEKQKRIVKQIMGFTSEKKVPLIMIHHYRKTFGKQSKSASTLDELSGSMKIVDGADRIINITRNWDPEAKYPQKYMSTVILQKGREYPDSMKKVYFIHGTFVDEAPPFDPNDPLEGKSEVEYLAENQAAAEEKLNSEHQEQLRMSAMFGGKD
jgi:hypothetical protein